MATALPAIGGVKRAILDGPVQRHQRRLGLGPSRVQCAHVLETGEDAERSVEIAAGRLRVQVAADGDRRVGGLRPVRCSSMVPTRLTLTVSPTASLQRTSRWRASLSLSARV